MYGNHYSLGELVGIIGSNRITKRRIGRYISKGLVDRPIGGRGRGVYYTDNHVRQILFVLDTMENNVTLADLYDRIHPEEDDEWS